MVAQAALLEAVARRTTDFDVIHMHIDWLHLPLLSHLGDPLFDNLPWAHGLAGLFRSGRPLCRRAFRFDIR